MGLSQMPKRMLMLGTDITDMVLDMDMATDTMVDTTDIPTGHTDTTERGLLMLSQQLNQMLKLMLMLDTDTTERGLPMLSQRPRLSLQLILTTFDTMVLAWDTTDTDMLDTDTPSPAHCGVPAMPD